ncbi:MAG: DUF202 domain-containing protein [Nitrospiraceae bacterium]|jgi:putative membrane protein|nr:DUF202 domain-containing protein [Nitrospiraceae bacterium]
MDLPQEQNMHPRVLNRRTHMANERTFLAWIRTSIGIMAFGFVLEKFGLFLKQYAFIIDASGGLKIHRVSATEYSSFWGVFLVGLGALMGVLAFFRYKSVEKQIDENRYERSLLLDAMLTIAVLATGIFLVVYLVHSF